MTLLRPIFSYTIVIAIIVCVFGFLIAAVGANIKEKTNKIAQLEQTIERKDQELNQSKERQKIATDLTGEMLVFMMYAAGEEPTDEQLIGLGITELDAWKQGLQLGYKESTQGFKAQETVSPLPETDAAFDAASIGYIAGNLLGCSDKQTSDCIATRQQLHETFYSPIQSIVQGTVSALPQPLVTQLKCPEHYASQEEYMAGLSQWLGEFRVTHPDATLDELAAMRDQFLKDNNCQETLEYIQSNSGTN